MKGHKAEELNVGHGPMYAEIQPPAVEGHKSPHSLAMPHDGVWRSTSGGQSTF